MQAVEEKPVAAVIPALGDRIVFSSKYTGFETDAFDEQFALVTKHELGQMLPGQTLYLSLGSLYPQGGVIGWVKIAIEKIHALGDGGFSELVITFKGGAVTGSRTIKRGLRNEFARAVDENALAIIIHSFPLSKSPYPPRT